MVIIICDVLINEEKNNLEVIEISVRVFETSEILEKPL